MGDIIHTLPAITDAVNACPDIKFTWLVDQSFSEICHWHPAVQRVIPLELRTRQTAQIISTLQQVRATKYDMVIDAQGLLKSAIFTKLARARVRAGFDRKSAREALASLCYTRKINVPKQIHAVDRLRRLFAGALQYPLPDTNADYGVTWDTFVKQQEIIEPYLVFLHGTTWQSKHWPEEYWLHLAKLAALQGYKVHVTWATEEQKLRAQRLQAYSTNVIMLPHMSLQEALKAIYHASGVVAVDTGLAHLSAALAKPTVAIYGATDIYRSGASGLQSINLASAFSCAPCMQRTCKVPGADQNKPPCYKEITPQIVWANLASLL